MTTHESTHHFGLATMASTTARRFIARIIGLLSLSASRFGRRPAVLGPVSVVFALLAILLQVRPSPGQNCVPGALVAAPGIPDERYVHIGDNMHFYIQLEADASSCLLDGGNIWAILPDGTVHLINTNYAKSVCGQTFIKNCPMDEDCVSDLPVEIGPSGFLRFEYGPIAAADVGRSLPQFVTPRGSRFQPGPPLAGQISIGVITDAQTTDCADPAIHDMATAQGIRHITVVTPGISITKQCVSNCAPMSPMAPIGFAGQVCNTGDIALTNVTVSDGVGGIAITFANQTAMGNPFPVAGARHLVPGDCVTYMGVFSPADSPAGPFPNTVVACGTDMSSVPKPVWSTNGLVPVFGARREGNDFVFSFAAGGQSKNYTVQFTDSLSPANWQTLTNLPSDGKVATIRNSANNPQRFYRVLAE